MNLRAFSIYALGLAAMAREFFNSHWSNTFSFFDHAYPKQKGKLKQDIRTIHRKISRSKYK